MKMQSMKTKVYTLSWNTFNTQPTRALLKLHIGRVQVHASASQDDTRGVLSLLKRDYKEPKLPDNDVFTNSEITSSQSDNEVAGNAASSTSVKASSPKELNENFEIRGKPNSQMKCKDAIQQGLELFAQQKYGEAVEAFRLSLELPGSGVMREAGSPREFACASEGEENAALYNMACCYCKLGQISSAYTCIEALLENGFEDVHALKSDPDLSPIQGPKLNELLSKHTDFFKQLFKQRKSSNNPWLQW